MDLLSTSLLQQHFPFAYKAMSARTGPRMTPVPIHSTSNNEMKFASSYQISVVKEFQLCLYWPGVHVVPCFMSCSSPGILLVLYGTIPESIFYSSTECEK